MKLHVAEAFQVWTCRWFRRTRVDALSPGSSFGVRGGVEVRLGDGESNTGWKGMRVFGGVRVFGGYNGITVAITSPF